MYTLHPHCHQKENSFLPSYFYRYQGRRSPLSHLPTFTFSHCHVPTEFLDTQAVLGLRACWFISYHLSWRNLLLLLFSRSVISNSFVTLWTVAHQAPLSMEFPRQEYWSGLSFPPPEDLPDPGITHLLHWPVDSLPLSHPGNPS